MIIKRKVDIVRFNIWANGLKNYVCAAEKDPESFVGHERSVGLAKIELDGLLKYSYVQEHECNIETGEIRIVRCTLTDRRLDMVSDLSNWSMLGEFFDYSPILIEKLRKYVSECDARYAEIARMQEQIRIDYAVYLLDESVKKHNKADFARKYEYDYSLVIKTSM